MSAPYFAYGAVGLTGTDGALDTIHSQVLRDNDLAVVVDDSKIYFYQMHARSTEATNPPYIVKPIDEDGDKRWHLISQEIYTTDIIQLVGDYIQTSKIKAISGNEIQLQASNGQVVRVNTDGSVTFPSFITVDEEPTSDNHATNKLYVDNEIISAHNTLEIYIDDEVNNIESELETYTDGEFDTKYSELETHLTNEVNLDFDTKETNLENYINIEIGNLQSNLEDYTDQEINNVVDNVYPILLFEIDTWNEFENDYYADVNHNKNKNNTIVRCWDEENMIVYPDRIETLDNKNIRIWMPVNDKILKVVIL